MDFKRAAKQAASYLCRDGTCGLCLQAQSQTDRNDARGMAQMMRGDLIAVHVKTIRSQKLTMLDHRKTACSPRLAIDKTCAAPA